MLRRGDIAASDHWYRDCLFHLSNNIPVCKPAVTLLASATVNRHHVTAAVLNQSCNFNRVDGGVIPPRAYFHGYRNGDRFSDPAQNLFKLWQITKQRRSASPVHDLLGRASAVYVYDVRAGFLDNLGSGNHSSVVISEYLDRKRSFLGEKLHHPVSTHIAASYPLDGYELRDNQSDTAEFFDQPPKRRVGYASHRSKDEVRGDSDVSYVNRVFHE